MNHEPDFINGIYRSDFYAILAFLYRKQECDADVRKAIDMLMFGIEIQDDRIHWDWDEDFGFVILSYDLDKHPYQAILGYEVAVTGYHIKMIFYCGHSKIAEFGVENVVRAFDLCV